MSEKIPVNDGGGLYTNEGLIDALVVDCNDLQKALVSGQYVLFCSLIVQMVQKLGALKKGVKDELAASEERYQEMRRLCEEMAGESENGGDENGVGD